MAGPSLKPWIAAIRPYAPGASEGADGAPLVKLSANENPYGCSPVALEALAAARNPADYPDPDARALRAAIGTAHGIDPARIVCGAGSGELLQCAVQAFAGPGDEVVFPRYSFSLYPLLAMKVGAQGVHAEPRDYAASAETLLAAVTPRTRVVLVDNPNNPVGSRLSALEIARLHAGLPGHVLLVIDHAYAEYAGADDGGLALAARHDNVLVTRTFSKVFGLAGERVGWATGAPGLIGGINRLRGAFNVSAGGQRAALAALGDTEFISASAQRNAAVRRDFEAAVARLGNHGLRAIPSSANFVLVLFEGALTAEAARAALEAAGYAVRHLPGQGLGHALRITMGTEAQMAEVAAVLAQAASGSAR
ncbi:pyridoxal phosphate-dependent aminotransferase [Qipengyuania sediminis]|uniref:pyridoxal phosphate-dependent aminotransferase n=1 Tax=Qipengyuania sediminis TaxID=1532023 RepID=UPI0010593BB1|nr:histidinol-phosphate transaminase [Qipengyuania sediminis]